VAFVKICWIITALAASAGALTFFVTVAHASLSSDEAAGAAMAAALAIIPYVFTRCMEGLIEPGRAPAAKAAAPSQAPAQP
jgi:hypothetical protein